MDFKTLLCYIGDQSSLTTPGTIVHTQPVGRLAAMLQWQPGLYAGSNYCQSHVLVDTWMLTVKIVYKLSNCA